MSRLAPLDKALVLILVPIWVFCFTLGVRAQLRGGGIPALELSVAGGDDYPTLTGDFSPLAASDPLAESGLRAGDRLVRVGDADLRGVALLGFNARVLDQAGSDLRVPLVFERDGQQLETSLTLTPVSVLGPPLACSLPVVLSALFLLLRSRPTPMVRAYFYAAMAGAFCITTYWGSGVELYASLVTLAAGMSVFFPLVFHFLYLYPDERPPKGRWHRIFPWFFAVLHCGGNVVGMTARVAIGFRIYSVGIALGLLAALVVATRKYQRADPIGRRQMKWVVLGCYCAFVPIAIALSMALLDPRYSWLYFVGFWFVPILPLSLVLSVVRFNVVDIDRVLSATASYNVLLVLLGAAALVLVPRLAAAASGTLGIDPGAGQVVLSLLLAGVAVPAHRRLRPQIDRLFFKERYALDHGIADLLPSLSECADARVLTERIGEGLNRLLRPDGCVVYALVEESYVPVFAEGSAVPPAFEATSPLVDTLGDRRKPLSLGDAGRRPDDAPLGPFDRAALETLGAEVVVPVRRDQALAAFVCLGPKGSGDVYTSTDISQLASVAETASQQLRRFDQEETVREAREMQDSLRRYVPGAIAEQLGRGEELVSGEREVTVLFVDIRGYTSFSESRRADEIFSTVNRYTETVSQIVQKHAGSVVEFNGDGMMAVFGAPRELAHKERAAVEAGREIGEAVGELPVESGEALSVGVGIATGEAFVGNIQAVDRMIWSAIGNTTNLAARLQSLTRDLNAALVVDGATWKKAQPAAADFEKRSEVPIRGRRGTQDVYALPMKTDS